MNAAAILSILVLLANAVPQAESFAAAMREAAAKEPLQRELALYRRFTLAHNQAARYATQVAITRLASHLRPQAQALIAPLFSARTEFEIDLATALINRELEP